MNLFKQRVVEMLCFLLAATIMAGLLFLIFLLLYTIPFDLGGWISYFVVSLFLLLFILSFLNWLVIEPFKESYLYWKIKNKKVKQK